MPARILIVDDHEIVREGIRTLIGRSRRDWQICGEASNGEDAVEAVKTLKPDLVILDISMPRMNGLEAASTIVRLNLGTRVLLFTMHESERLLAEVRQVGAQGLVLKSQASRDLVHAIERLLGGETFFGPSVAGTRPKPAGPSPREKSKSDPQCRMRDRSVPRTVFATRRTGNGQLNRGESWPRRGVQGITHIRPAASVRG